MTEKHIELKKNLAIFLVFNRFLIRKAYFLLHKKYSCVVYLFEVTK